ncbi:MAG: hypothetical protein RR140_00350 [Clostridia bacterium]
MEIFDKNLAKALLTCYRYLERVTASLDKIFQTRAMGSFAWQGSIELLTNKLIGLTERKTTLINLKIIIEKALLTMDLQGAKLLVKKFVDCEKIEKIADNIKCSRRNVSRKINSAIQSFGMALRRQNFSQEKVLNLIKSENWIKQIQNSFIEKPTYAEDEIDDRFVRSVCLSIARA